MTEKNKTMQKEEATKPTGLHVRKLEQGYMKEHGFTVVFTVITKRRALPEEASIHTAEMTVIKVALKEIHKREDKRWVIYTVH